MTVARVDAGAGRGGSGGVASTAMKARWLLAASVLLVTGLVVAAIVAPADRIEPGDRGTERDDRTTEDGEQAAEAGGA